MITRLMILGMFLFVLGLWTWGDIVSLQSRGVLRAGPFKDHLKWYFDNSIRDLIFNCVAAVALLVFLSIVTFSWINVIVYGLLALFYTFMIARWWWNRRGRKKVAEKLAGYKHRAVLAKLGVVRT